MKLYLSGAPFWPLGTLAYIGPSTNEIDKATTTLKPAAPTGLNSGSDCCCRHDHPSVTTELNKGSTASRKESELDTSSPHYPLIGCNLLIKMKNVTWESPKSFDSDPTPLGSSCTMSIVLDNRKSQNESICQIRFIINHKVVLLALSSFKLYLF